ncbi:MAG TPA: sulfite exporter TauE/SafE family protein [Chryseolinea sp.]|nr:sulfite exporter TauE/SafE family protein [Chryseolinea sp.]HPM32063.1 sulfite exporter TauE/SafE family protein [Chryseolinea sp.]
MEFPLLILFFFIIALVYSSVGFGGGSSYLAVLAQPFFMLLPEEIRPIALCCNIIVVTGGAIIFYKEGKIEWREVWPFLVFSVPMAYLGGFWKLEHHTFFIVLGITLIVASLFLWIQPEKMNENKKMNESLPVKITLGAGIGFLSGLVSIGGGIFLSPILHLLKWSEPKKISALASLFILFNSFSGLAGQINRGLPPVNYSFVGGLMLAVFFGGQIGSRLGARKFNPLYIKRITAALILIAGAFILKEHL